MHYGRAEKIITDRQRVLTRFYEAHPERFVNGLPQHPVLASEVWINPPARKTTPEVAAGATLETPADSKGTLIFNTYGDSADGSVAARRKIVDLQGGGYTKYQEIVSQNY